VERNRGNAISRRAGKSSRIPIFGEKRQLFTSPAIIGSGSGEKASLPNPAHFDAVSLLPLSIPSNGRPRLARRRPPARGSLVPCTLARRSRTAEGSDGLHARCCERRGIARVANVIAAEIQARIDRETVARPGAALRAPPACSTRSWSAHCSSTGTACSRLWRRGSRTPAWCARSTGWWPPSVGHSWTSSEQGHASPSRGDGDAA
jgi:hypothetical protein